MMQSTAQFIRLHSTTIDITNVSRDVAVVLRISFPSLTKGEDVERSVAVVSLPRMVGEKFQKLQKIDKK